MRLSGIKFWAIALFVVSAIQVAVVSCKDDPGVENYYTQSKEYAADYLRSREQYSEYLKILERARGEYELHLVDMLGTYGSYTVFAPTNAAVEKYLAERGLASVDELSIDIRRIVGLIMNNIARCYIFIFQRSCAWIDNITPCNVINLKGS